MNDQIFFTTVPALTRTWVESANVPLNVPLKVSSTTGVSESNCVVMFQGKPVIGTRGQNELLVSIDPASLGRKLAVLRVTAQLDGQSVTSTSTSL